MASPTLSRRSLLGSGALLGAFAASRGLVAGALPPKETGLPFEGLLKGKAGFQPRSPSPLPRRAIPGFLSAEQLDRNYAVYRAAFGRLLAAEKELARAPRDEAHSKEYAGLRNEQVLAGNSVLLHEFYFRNLAQAALKPSRYVLGNMTEHMGSLDGWREDFAACARVADTWAVLVYDPYDDRWHNLALGETNSGGWVGANPLIVCDVAAHAYSVDYKEREAYVAAFLEHIDWNVVAARYRAVDRR
jgi:superoxide dismutase, Fe-Mn family